MSDLFQKSGPKHLEFRKDLEVIVEVLNNIAINPFEEVIIPEELTAGMPFKWNFQQIYLLLDSLHGILKFSTLCFIIVDEKSKVVDCSLIETERIEEKNTTNSGENQSYLEFSHNFIKDTDENGQFFDNLSEKIKNMENVKPIIQEFVKDQFNYDFIHTFIIPYNIKQILIALKLPSFNIDTLNFFNVIVEWKELIENFAVDTRSKYIISQIDQNRTITDYMKIFNRIQNIDLDKWEKIIISLSDGFMNTSIIANEDRVLLGFKTIVNDKKLTINPLPIKMLRKINGKGYTKEKMAEEMFNQTGLRTNVMTTQDLIKSLDLLKDPNINLFNIMGEFFTLFQSSYWYPDSLLNSFLKLFGFELGEGINKLPIAFKTVISYFKSVLIVVFQSEEDSKKPSEALVHIYLEDNNVKINLIDTTKLKDLETDADISPVDYLKALKTKLQSTSGKNFNACFGFDIDILADSLSASNMQAFLGIREMANQLPFIVSMGGLIASMKALGVEQAINTEDDPLVKLYQEDEGDTEPSEKPEISDIDTPKFKNYFDQFLKKGILFIVDDDKRDMKKIRSPIYSKDGYLGLDLEILREQMEKSE
jgi:hypothetical protein